jgi:hypothetical protein
MEDSMDNSHLVSQNEQNTIQSLDTDSSKSEKKKGCTKVFVVSAVMVVVCLCISISVCVVAGGWVSATNLKKVVLEREDISAVIDKFMVEMEKGNTESAYVLFSKRTQLQVPLTELEKLHEVNYNEFFVDYEGVWLKEL